MKIRLDVNERGEWQADVWTLDGKDLHAVGKEPWEALIRLGSYWEGFERAREATTPKEAHDG